MLPIDQLLAGFVAGVRRLLPLEIFACFFNKLIDQDDFLFSQKIRLLKFERGVEEIIKESK